MKRDFVEIEWPNGEHSFVAPGSNWLGSALEVGVEIPTGCLGGSCGACEIEVNGEVLRACIDNVPSLDNSKLLKVDFVTDPYWDQ